MGKTKEAVISTERVNEVGSRVITVGVDYAQYERNPVLLYMHQRGGDRMPIGRVENLRLDGAKIIGTPVFDLNDEFAKRIADKWENNFLRMLSPKFEIVETSNDPALILVGQTRETITRSKLIEISIVDIGGNDDALQLCYNGKTLELGSGATCDALPLLSLNKENPDEGNSNNQNLQNMKTIFLALGLSETATSDQAVAAISALKDRAENGEKLALAAVAGIVDAAIADTRINADQKDHYLALGKSMGADFLSKTLAPLKTAAKPTDFIDERGGKKETLELKWGDLTPATAEKLKGENPKQYIALYKAEFGVAPTLEA